MPARVTGPQSVLVVTLGAEPQVVTLTLDALLNRGFEIRRVAILHTSPSSPAIRDALARLRAEEPSYRLRDPPITFRYEPIQDGARLPADIVSEEDAAALLRSLYRVVASCKRQHLVVHLSIAGGRKVMAAYGMLVAQLLLEESDHVWHLLSEGRLQASREMHAANAAEVALIPVPVLRWSLLPSTVQDLLVWEDPYRAIARQRELRDREHAQSLRQFWSELTPAERDVVRALVTSGSTNRELARRLNRSEKTLANQLQSVYDKYRTCLGIEVRSRVRDRLVLDLAPFVDSIGKTDQASVGRPTQAATRSKRYGLE